MSGWAADLRAHPSCAGKEVVEVAWKPPKLTSASAVGESKPAGRGGGAGNTLPAQARRGEASAAGGRPPRGGAVRGGAVAQPTVGVARLWAFGNEVVRRRVREVVADWAEGADLFVA